MPHPARRALTAALLAVVLISVATPLAAATPPPQNGSAPSSTRVSVSPSTSARRASSPPPRRASRSSCTRGCCTCGSFREEKAKCRTAPTVTVATWRADGYARAGEGIYAPCPGGGYDQIYIKRDGAWTAPRFLGSQEVRSCSLQRWFDIPLPVADRTCYSDFGELIEYGTYQLPDDFSTGDYAARVLAASFEDKTGVGDAWASDRVLTELRARQDDGAKRFTVVRCFGADDAEYGALLGKAPRGCRLDVRYADHTDTVVMRLYPARFGRWTTRSLELVYGDPVAHGLRIAPSLTNGRPLPSMGCLLGLSNSCQRPRCSPSLRCSA